MSGVKKINNKKRKYGSKNLKHSVAIKSSKSCNYTPSRSECHPTVNQISPNNLTSPPPVYKPLSDAILNQYSSNRILMVQMLQQYPWLNPLFSFPIALKARQMFLEAQRDDAVKKESDMTDAGTTNSFFVDLPRKPLDSEDSNTVAKNSNESAMSPDEEIIMKGSPTHDYNSDCEKEADEKCTSVAQNLRHLEILAQISKMKKEKSKHIQEATECRLCGNCSFATAGYQLAFMKQHLYTHITHPLYSCSLCLNYNSNAKNRVIAHLRKLHGKTAKCSKNIRDNRLELDDELVKLAKSCYGSLIVESK